MQIFVGQYSRCGKRTRSSTIMLGVTDGFDSRSLQELFVKDFLEHKLSSWLPHDLHMQNGHSQRKLSVKNCGSVHRILNTKLRGGLCPSGGVTPRRGKKNHENFLRVSSCNFFRDFSRCFFKDSPESASGI